MAQNGTAERSLTYREYRTRGEVPRDRHDELLIDETMSLIIGMLRQRRDRETVALLTRTARIELEHDDDRWNDGEQTLYIEYEPEDGPDFESHEEVLQDVCRYAARRAFLPISGLLVRETLPVVGFGWREQALSTIKGDRPTNQARRVRAETAAPTFVEDSLAFTNEGELKVYRALKRMQENDFPGDDTIGIYPLASGRIPSHTWEPDFLITYQGRTGVLEVDGPHHNQRRALDTTREHLLRESGIATVDRVTVEAVDDQNELEKTLRRLMRNLQRHR